MKTKISRKKKAGITASILLVGSILLLSTITLAHPPQPPVPPIRCFKGDVTVSLNASDPGSGVAYTSIAVWYKSTENGDWELLLAPTNYTGPITYSPGGYYQVHYFSVDRCNNIEAEKFETFRVIVDTIPPVTTITLDGFEITPE